MNLKNGDHLSEQISEASEALKSLQQPDGHWVFELEADATIPSEYIFLQHFLDEIDLDEERKISTYLRNAQADHGGWALFEGGEFNLSVSVKVYFALKLAGDAPEAPHMRLARKKILEHGGAAKANVFTRISLALFGQVPWRAVPVMPVELILLPVNSPFHISKVSYWSRTVIVPLLILMALKPRARNPRGVDIAELFTTPPEKERSYITDLTGTLIGRAFVGIDKVLRMAEPFLPSNKRQKAIEKAVAFIRERLNGEDGLGGIFPAMTNTVMAFDALGYGPEHPDLRTAKRAIKKLLVMHKDHGYCQPCLSPIWDTALTSLALIEAGESPQNPSLEAACEWLRDREITETRGDWSWQRPELSPSGWAFQYRNDHYPDLDDTAVVVMLLHFVNARRYKESIQRASRWVIHMQTKNGGWGSFDAENTYYYLNKIPFADHGALLDPPTADVTARCVNMLARLGHSLRHPAVRRAVNFLFQNQESDGSWHGRWGVNYIYGTWSVLSSFHALGINPASPPIQKAVTWLKSHQREDGGWGEDCASYIYNGNTKTKESTPSQTAWALLGLMAAEEAGSETVKRGVSFLQNAPRDGARWEEDSYTGVGFPRKFYLKYHGYSAYFPLWALSTYKNLSQGAPQKTGIHM